MMIKKAFLSLVFVAVAITSWNCGVGKGGFNLFTIEDDKALGKQVSEEIAKDPTKYPI